MHAALIAMTILGCDDAVTDCHYITTAERRWPTIEMCDAVSEKELGRHAEQPYPMIIAVCQNPETAAIADIPVAPAAPGASGPVSQPIAVTPQEEETLASSAIRRVKSVLPTTEGVKTLMTKPVRLVEDGYSWVARKFQQ